MVKKIVVVKDPRLREKSKSVKNIDKKILKLIQDLHDTLLAQKDPEGVGLAGPQIGKNYRVFVVKLEGNVKTFINPKIVSDIKEKKLKKAKKDAPGPQKIMEGCLSLPHYYGPLKRSNKIKVSYLDEKGEKKVETFESFSAQIIHHEIDHLNGILFIDRLLEQKKPLYELVGENWQEVEI
jgi:peptide deformylase